MEEGTYIAPQATPEPQKDNTLWIVLAVVVGLIVICCCCVAAFLLLSGPIVGEVFSNIFQYY